MSAEVLFRLGAELGEGPSWTATTSELSWVDITAGHIYRSDLTAIRGVIDVGMHVGAAMPAGDGGFVAARRDGFAYVPVDGPAQPLSLPLDGDPSVRFNDGKTDPSGRPFAGTMAYDMAAGRGALYRLDPPGDATAVLTDLGIANGLAWSSNGTRLFFIDSAERRVDVFDFDVATGLIGSRAVHLDLDAYSGMPDGMCIDDDDCLWIAFWGGHAVRRFDPNGNLVHEIMLPVSQPTSCCLAGNTLIITTATYALSTKELHAEPHAGDIFAADVEVGGPPATPVQPDVFASAHNDEATT